MSSLQGLVLRRQTVESTKKLMSAMKVVASTRMRQMLHKFEQAALHEARLAKAVGSLKIEEREVLPWYAQPSEPQIWVVLGADKSLCGSFHTNIVRSVVDACASRPFAAKKRCFYVWGTKTAKALARAGFVATKERARGRLQASEAAQLFFEDLESLGAQLASPGKSSSHISSKRLVMPSVMLVVPCFQSALVQNVRFFPFYDWFQTFLAFAPQNSASTLDQTSQSDQKESLLKAPLGETQHTKNKEKEASQKGVAKKTDRASVTLIEPSLHVFFRHFFNIYGNFLFQKAFIESRLSEEAARMTAMDSANRNSEDILKDITLLYNRTRQAMITKELIEVISGANAL